MSFSTCLWIMLGGALGTLARHGLTVLAKPISEGIPWGTILINVVGSLVIGFFATWTREDGRSPAAENMRLFVMVGVCGGFTTFSAFSLQTLELMQRNSPGRAGANVLLSVSLCLVAVWLGHLIADRESGPRPDSAQAGVLAPGEESS